MLFVINIFYAMSPQPNGWLWQVTIFQPNHIATLVILALYVWLVYISIVCQQILRYQSISRDHFLYAPWQWEMVLHCNTISHWLGAYTNNHWISLRNFDLLLDFSQTVLFFVLFCFVLFSPQLLFLLIMTQQNLSDWLCDLMAFLWSKYPYHWSQICDSDHCCSECCPGHCPEDPFPSGMTRKSSLWSLCDPAMYQGCISVHGAGLTRMSISYHGLECSGEVRVISLGTWSSSSGFLMVFCVYVW